MKNGIPSTLNASSSSARPTDVRNAACKTSFCIFLSVVDSSPCVPPGYTVSVTRPMVSLFQVLPMSSSALCHEVLAGTSVASLMSVAAERVTQARMTIAIDSRIRTDIYPHFVNIVSM